MLYIMIIILSVIFIVTVFVVGAIVASVAFLSVQRQHARMARLIANGAASVVGHNDSANASHAQSRQRRKRRNAWP